MSRVRLGTSKKGDQSSHSHAFGHETVRSFLRSFFFAFRSGCLQIRWNSGSGSAVAWSSGLRTYENIAKGRCPIGECCGFRGRGGGPLVKAKNTGLKTRHYRAKERALDGARDDKEQRLEVRKTKSREGTGLPGIKHRGAEGAKDPPLHRFPAARCLQWLKPHSLLDAARGG
jgi:hypothetical protein